MKFFLVWTLLLFSIEISYCQVIEREIERKIEREEEHIAVETPEKKIFHLCIVNLVIG